MGAPFATMKVVLYSNHSLLVLLLSHAESPFSFAQFCFRLHSLNHSLSFRTLFITLAFNGFAEAH